MSTKTLLSLCLALSILGLFPGLLRADLIAHYPLDGDGTDNSVNDNSANVLGSTPTADRNANTNSAMAFNGSDNALLAITIPAYDGLQAITISIWIRSVRVKTQILVDKGNSFSLSTSATGDLIFSASSSGSHFNTQARTAFSLDQNWRHIVGRYDGTELTLWADGVQIASEPLTGAIADDNASLFIGSRTLTSGNSFEGDLDDLKIYDHALSDAEIVALATDSGSEEGGGTEPPEIVIEREEGDLTQECASVDADLNIYLPCVEVGNLFYSVPLVPMDNPADPEGYYWTLGDSELDVVTLNNNCSTVNSTFDATIPCVNIGDATYYEAELLGQILPSTPPLHYWSLGDFQPVVEAPRLTMMVAEEVGVIQMDWLAGNDGLTPEGQVTYHVYLSEIEDFVLDQSTLVTSVIDADQARISNLSTGTEYFGKVVAEYANAVFSPPSNELSTKTFTLPVMYNSLMTLVSAAELGLGHHRIEVDEDGEAMESDQLTLIYDQGANAITVPSIDPLNPNYIIVSENSEGELVIGTVVDVQAIGDDLEVTTLDASITDVVTQGALNFETQFFDLAEESVAGGKQAKVTKVKDGSIHRRVEWADGSLVAEQINYADKGDGLIVVPEGETSVIKIMGEGTTKDVSHELKLTITPKFDPKVNFSSEWSGFANSRLDYAEFIVDGTLSLKAIAEYNFEATGEFGPRTATLFRKSWRKAFAIGYLPVYARVTVTLKAQVSGEAELSLGAASEVNLTEKIKLGAKYYWTTGWETVGVRNPGRSYKATLTAAGGATVDVRLIPSVEVSLYEASQGDLSVEPYVEASIGAETVPNESIHSVLPPLHMTNFDFHLGLESNVELKMEAFGEEWQPLEKTCLYGTRDECVESVNPLQLFSLPTLEPLIVQDEDGNENQKRIIFKASNGVQNPFRADSVKFEVYPPDAFFSEDDPFCDYLEPLRCNGVLTLGSEPEYLVYASGYGVLGELSRQYVTAVVRRPGENTDPGGGGGVGTEPDPEPGPTPEPDPEYDPGPDTTIICTADLATCEIRACISAGNVWHAEYLDGALVFRGCISGEP